MLILSDVPTDVHQQHIYLEKLKKEAEIVLNLSSEWSINIAVGHGDLPKGRRLSLTSDLGVSIFVISLSAGPGDILKMQSKLDSPAFLDQLNARGFKASKARLQFATTTSGE